MYYILHIWSAIFAIYLHKKAFSSKVKLALGQHIVLVLLALLLYILHIFVSVK